MPAEIKSRGTLDQLDPNPTLPTSHLVPLGLGPGEVAGSGGHPRNASPHSAALVADIMVAQCK